MPYCTFKPYTVSAPTGYKALVTGAAGFIGSHVAKDCLNLGFEVVAVMTCQEGFVGTYQTVRD